MRRRIYLAIAFALSFMIMFAISLARETTAQIPVDTPNSIKSESVQYQPEHSNQAISSLSRKTVNDENAEIAKQQILKAIHLGPECNVICPNFNGALGYMRGSLCLPC